MQTHRHHLVDHPDGRQTIAIFSCSEMASMFSAHEVALLLVGKTIPHAGRRHTDLQAFVNTHRRVEEPRASLIERMRQRLFPVPPDGLPVSARERPGDPRSAEPPSMATDLRDLMALAGPLPTPRQTHARARIPSHGPFIPGEALS